jgi:hypothetical protein
VIRSIRRIVDASAGPTLFDRRDVSIDGTAEPLFYWLPPTLVRLLLRLFAAISLRSMTFW